MLSPFIYFVNTFDVCQALQLKVSKIKSFALLLWSTVPVGGAL